MNSLFQREQNDLRGLQFVNVFGWLRAPELGGLMWPRNPSSAEAANRVVRGWERRGLIIVRTLPERAGRAAVLSAAGVRLLQEHGTTAKTGKDLGVFRPNGWMPSASWKHDLIATGIVVALHKEGFLFVTEAVLRQQHSRAPKIPDGLVQSPSRQWIWLEVEHARKSGPHMRLMAKTLAQVCQGNGPVLNDVQCTAVMVGYCKTDDERGYRIDHEARVLSAIRAHITHDITIEFVCCRMKGFGVESIERYERVLYFYDVVLDGLNAFGWRDRDNESKEASYGGYVATVYPEDPQISPYGYCVTKAGVPVGASYADTVDEGKRGCAELIAQALRSTVS